MRAKNTHVTAWENEEREMMQKQERAREREQVAKDKYACEREKGVAIDYSVFIVSYLVVYQSSE